MQESCLTASQLASLTVGKAVKRISLKTPVEQRACHTNGSCKLITAGSSPQQNIGQLSM